MRLIFSRKDKYYHYIISNHIQKDQYYQNQYFFKEQVFSLHLHQNVDSNGHFFGGRGTIFFEIVKSTLRGPAIVTYSDIAPGRGVSNK